MSESPPAKVLPGDTTDAESTYKPLSIVTPEGERQVVEEVEQEKSTETTAEEAVHQDGLKLVLLVSASIIAVFLIALDQTIVGTAIPKITDEFHGLSDISWYAAAYFMTFGGTQTSAGKLYKYFDLKWTFLMAMLVFEVGSLICGVAQNSKTLIVGRAIAGLGGAGLSVGGNSIVALVVPPVKRPIVMGMIGMTYTISAVLGPILGGVFTDRVTWRWCFYINLPIGAAAALAVFIFFQLPESLKPPKIPLGQKLLHVDPVGIVLVMGAITCFILALQYGGDTHPWNSSVVIGLLVGCVLLIAAVVLWEMWLGDYAMMTPRLYTRFVWVPAAFQFFFLGSYLTLLYYLPIYFQSILGASPILSGVYNLPLMVPAAIFALAGGIVVAKTGRAGPVMFASALLATVAVGLLLTLDIGSSTGKWAGYQVFLGATMAFGIVHGVTIAQAHATPADIASVTSNVLFWQVVGGAFSTSAGQSAFLNQLLLTLPKTAPEVNPRLVVLTGASELHNVFTPDVLPGVLEAYMKGITAAFGVATAFSGVAFLFSLLLPMDKLPTHKTDEVPAAIA
ncbi:major facilitator superfamily domain-containing protein [Echria macrotheca]|uniref:Major facilitator superfamily domain-containing protein n=1 Tax=Echria macrotheca TaxID=438768 RepID=A0AAJ0BR47_9PEZI|nr:major facilitator superfamily domain-containing protein [Echria macrotheca]